MDIYVHMHATILMELLQLFGLKRRLLSPDFFSTSSSSGMQRFQASLARSSTDDASQLAANGTSSAERAIRKRLTIVLGNFNVGMVQDMLGQKTRKNTLTG